MTFKGNYFVFVLMTRPLEERMMEDFYHML